MASASNLRGETFDRLVSTVDELRVDCTQWLIIEVGGCYVQLLFNHDCIFSEAVSNGYLVEARRLSPSQERRLYALGWDLLDDPCHPSCDSDHPNFQRIWPVEATSEAIVDAILRTLTAVYMRGEGEPITFKAGEHVSEPTGTAPHAA